MACLVKDKMVNLNVYSMKSSWLMWMANYQHHQWTIFSSGESFITIFSQGFAKVKVLIHESLAFSLYPSLSFLPLYQSCQIILRLFIYRIVDMCMTCDVFRMMNHLTLFFWDSFTSFYDLCLLLFNFLMIFYVLRVPLNDSSYYQSRAPSKQVIRST